MTIITMMTNVMSARVWFGFLGVILMSKRMINGTDGDNKQ
jgi:hypothetical protein